jgi:hypothetical protein
MDIMDFLESEDLKNIAYSEKPLIIFPFNVFGNIAPISLLLSKLRLMNTDFLISVYKNDSSTIEMRRKYYLNCGYNNLETIKDQTGFLFKSHEGLYTVAYDKYYLINLLGAFGFVVETLESKYGFAIYAKLEVAKNVSNKN